MQKDRVKEREADARIKVCLQGKTFPVRSGCEAVGPEPGHAPATARMQSWEAINMAQHKTVKLLKAFSHFLSCNLTAQRVDYTADSISPR